MLEKIRSVMRVYGLILPGPVRDVIIELGAEVDRLRSEVNELRSQTQSKG